MTILVTGGADTSAAMSFVNWVNAANPSRYWTISAPATAVLYCMAS